MWVGSRNADVWSDCWECGYGSNVKDTLLGVLHIALAQVKKTILWASSLVDDTR